MPSSRRERSFNQGMSSVMELNISIRYCRQREVNGRPLPEDFAWSLDGQSPPFLRFAQEHNPSVSRWLTAPFAQGSLKARAV